LIASLDALHETKFSNYQLAGHVKAFPTVPSLCYATGIGLHKAKADVEAIFQVITVDRNNELYAQGGDRIAVSVAPDDGDAFQG
jgi:hypothetical protein